MAEFHPCAERGEAPSLLFFESNKNKMVAFQKESLYNNCITMIIQQCNNTEGTWEENEAAYMY